MKRLSRHNRPAYPENHSRRARRSRSSAGAAIILLVLAGSGLCLAGAGRIPVRRVQQPVRLAEARREEAFAGNLPAEGHWIDTADGTAYMIQLQPNPKGFATFDFTTPTGQQLEGALPLVTLADGTLAQGTGIVRGAATNLPSAVVPRCQDGILQSDATSPISIVYTYLAHVSSDGMAAFATLSYASAQDQLGVAVLCKGVQGPGVTTYQMSAGCTLASCTDLSSLTGPTVASYDTALLAAEQNGSLSNWSSVYKLTSSQVTAQYDPADFANLLNQQVASVGKITSISTPLANPTVEFTPEGQAYFAVAQSVTYVRSGSTHKQSLTSYYILENGGWVFWFSS